MPQAHLFSLYAADGQRKYLNGLERNRFLSAAAAAEPRVRSLCLTLTYLGCRISEALNLKAGDVQREAGLIAIRCLKKRGQLMVREVPAPALLLDELGRVHGIEAGQARLWPWGRTTAWRAIKEVMRAAGITSLPASPVKSLPSAGLAHFACRLG